MTDFKPPKQPAELFPAADVKASAAPGKVEYESFPIKKPEEDLNDFKVQVRASTLTHVRTKLERLSKSAVAWHELALGGSSLAIGGFLGALPAKLTSGTAGAVFFYTILPVVGVSSLVAYLFLRREPLNEKDSPVAVPVVTTEGRPGA